MGSAQCQISIKAPPHGPEVLPPSWPPVTPAGTAALQWQVSKFELRARAPAGPELAPTEVTARRARCELHWQLVAPLASIITVFQAAELA